jgi:hypothetical protein
MAADAASATGLSPAGEVIPAGEIVPAGEVAAAGGTGGVASVGEGAVPDGLSVVNGASGVAVGAGGAALTGGPVDLQPAGDDGIAGRPGPRAAWRDWLGRLGTVRGADSGGSTTSAQRLAAPAAGHAANPHVLPHGRQPPPSVPVGGHGDQYC